MGERLMERIRLGTTLEDGLVYLDKHSWDCGWYWSFGYVGNSLYHFHIESLIQSVYEVDKIFMHTDIQQDQWWVIRDLFVQAYALQRAAEVYQFGGHQTHQAGVTDIINNRDMADKLNADLERVLDTVWTYMKEHINDN